MVWPGAKSASPLPTRAETDTWQEALWGSQDRKSFSENPVTNEKCSHLLLCQKTEFMANVELSPD